MSLCSFQSLIVFHGTAILLLYVSFNTKKYKKIGSKGLPGNEREMAIAQINCV